MTTFCTPSTSPSLRRRHTIGRATRTCMYRSGRAVCNNPTLHSKVSTVSLRPKCKAHHSAHARLFDHEARIEHLPEEVLITFAPILLGNYAPRLLLLTTPSYDFNECFR